MNLAAELERLAKREYPEEGIPMLIIADGPAAAGSAPELADAFRALAGQLGPDATEAEIARILEVVADGAFGPDALARE